MQLPLPTYWLADSTPRSYLRSYSKDCGQTMTQEELWRAITHERRKRNKRESSNSFLSKKILRGAL